MLPIEVPSHFICEPFYSKEDRVLEVGGENGKNYFAYDILYDVHKETKTPWRDVQKNIRPFFEKWETQREELYTLFSVRKAKEAAPCMKQAAAMYISLLFWINGQPVRRLNRLQEDIADLTYKPINCAERLMFLLQRVSSYQAYIQLTELFNELRKQYAKMLILHKK
ncbi:hypothetical protein PVE99_14215 [Priestia megaterium]|uniref:YpoC-like domain-containing protein n=1 Tax=Priestia megaterium TaxID=1404 RepID=A0ABD4WTN9_PRIMG|nr:hypothetical protein [Priestia megaterium]MDD9783540.1 hypothetical protein [Priestia megaterium]